MATMAENLSKLVEVHGQRGTARLLGILPNSVRWLLKNGRRADEHAILVAKVERLAKKIKP